MSDSTNSTKANLEAERVLTGAFTGVPQTIGTALVYNPTIIIFDNQSTVSVGVSDSASYIWKTFKAGEALVLDMRANHGQQDTYSFPIGTQFYGTGTAGAGSFRISVVY